MNEGKKSKGAYGTFTLIIVEIVSYYAFYLNAFGDVLKDS